MAGPSIPVPMKHKNCTAEYGIKPSFWGASKFVIKMQCSLTKMKFSYYNWINLVLSLHIYCHKKHFTYLYTDIIWNIALAVWNVLADKELMFEKVIIQTHLVSAFIRLCMKCVCLWNLSFCVSATTGLSGLTLPCRDTSHLSFQPMKAIYLAVFCDPFTLNSVSMQHS